MPKPLDDSSQARERRAAVGLRVRLLRTWRGWSQERLAAYAGIDRSQLARIELGQVNAGLDTLWSIADALTVDIADLFRAEKPAKWPPIGCSGQRSQPAGDNEDGKAAHDHD